MNQRVYIANLPTTTTEETLRAASAPYGTVSHVFLATDRDTALPKGYGFVTYSSAAEGSAAIAGLNGASFEGRTLTVSEAREPEVPVVRTFVRPPQPGRGGFGGRPGGRGPAGAPGRPQARG